MLIMLSIVDTEWLGTMTEFSRSKTLARFERKAPNIELAKLGVAQYYMDQPPVGKRQETQEGLSSLPAGELLS